MADPSQLGHSRRVENIIGRKVDERVHRALVESRGGLAFFASPEFGLLRRYLRPKLLAIGAIIGLGLVYALFEASKMLAMLAFVELLISPEVQGGKDISFFGLNLPLPVNRLPDERTAALGVLFGLIVAIFAGGALVKFLLEHTGIKVQHSFNQSVRAEVTRKTMRLNAAYFSEARMGDLAYLQNTVVNRFSSMVPVCQKMVTALLSIASIGIIIWALSPLLIIAVVVLGALLVAAVGIIRRPLAIFSFEVARLSRDTGAAFLDIIFGMRLIKQGAQEARAAERYLALARHREAAALKLNDLRMVTGLAVELGGAIALFLLILGAIAVSSQDMLENAGFTVAYFLLLHRAVSHANVFGEVRLQLATMLPHLAIVRDFLDDDTSEEMSSEPIHRPPAPKVRKGLEVRRLNFSYAEGKPILKDIWLHFPKGQRVALVGLSGSGKSTLLEILSRFRDPDSGEVLIDGTDIARYDLATYRRRVGYVAQETVMFNDTLRRNLAFLRPEASQEDIERAARLAGVEDFIGDLEAGYDTLIGERGFKVSGGQRQRIALARVLLQESDILLLDEATSACDLLTEARIYANLKDLKSEKVIIAAAHRLSAITDFDRIVVLNRGEVIEQGAHLELMAQKGLYYHLSELQEYDPDSDIEAAVASARS